MEFFVWGTFKKMVLFFETFCLEQENSEGKRNKTKKKLSKALTL